MAKLTDKSALITPANDDLLYIVDVNDTTDSAQGTSKKIEVQNLVGSSIPQSYLDTDGTLTANSDTKIATQKATKTYADTKLTNSMTTNKLLGRGTASTGVIEEITLGTNLTFSGTTLNATGGPTYEVGTWTPVIQGTTTAGTASYTTQLGAYTRIGDTCFVTLWVDYSGGTGTGNLKIGGLPFTVSTVQYSSLNVGWLINITLPANRVGTCYANLNTTDLILYTQLVGGGGGGSVVYDVAGNLNISGVYKIA